MTHARWFAGDDLAVVWPGGVALIDSTVGHEAAERVWARLHQESSLGAFLQVLASGSGAGFLDLPSFAIVVTGGDRWHIAVRGRMAADVIVRGAVESLSGEGITTWAERVLAVPDGVRIGSAGDQAAFGPITDGVVPATAVTLGEVVEAARRAPAPEPEQEVVPDGAQRPPSPESVVAVPDPVEDAPAAVVPAAAPPVEAEESAVPPEPPADAPDGTKSDEAMGAGAQETLAEGDAPPAPNKYESLWDQSIALDVEAAAIRPEGAEQPAQPEPRTAQHDPADQLFGDTVADAGVVAIEMTSQAPDAPEVLARLCERGHANPPERASCFVCGAEVSGEARRAPRPQLGWLRVEGGETVPLHGPVIAGRNPKTAGVKLDQAPRLLALPHPHVSGTHLVILLEGWRILVRDLRSSNGTYLRRHGKPPIRLPETAVPLVPGDLIDLGKGLYLHLDGTP